MITMNTGRKFAVLLFGIIVPMIVLAQAYIGLASLGKEIRYKHSGAEIVQTMEAAKKSLSTANDYALFSLMYTESTNLNAMLNKQVMKVSTMQIGFSVSSIGVMLIILGIKGEGAQAGAEAPGIKFDFKSGSAGVVVFLVGAAMATAGGALKNEYSTVPSPNYLHVESESEGIHASELIAYKKCKQVERFETCFADLFAQLRTGELQ